MSTETQVESPLAEELSKTADLLKPKAKRRAPKHRTAGLLAPERKAKAKAKAKSAKEKTKRAKAKPVSGQSGPHIESLPWEDLNKKEKQVLGCFNLKGEREIRTIEALAKGAFPSQPLKKGNSWVRNSLRRPIRADWLEKPKPGEYRLTAAGRKRLVRADS